MKNRPESSTQTLDSGNASAVAEERAAQEGISVVYPTRDRPELLMRSLNALLENNVLPDEILVVDQSRDDATRRALAALNCARVVHVPSDETGLSRGRNQGILKSRFPIIGFLDDDCIPAKNWIQSAREAIQAFPRSHAWVGEVFATATDDPESIPQDIPKKYTRARGFHNPWRMGPWGGNSFFRKSAFDKAGLFDPFLGQGSDFPGAEDGDMIYRIMKKNLRVTHINTIRCVHVGWRGDEEEICNGYNYGMGVGAMLAKYAANGDYYPLGVIFPRSFLSRYFAVPFNLMLGRKKKFGIHLGWSRGIVEGFLKWRRMRL
ncbi:MAG: glycosyltransferase family 2 protein [Nitrospinales bacterium]